MKKTLLLAAAGLLSLAASAQTEEATEYTYVGGTPTAATELVNDGLYFIFDNFNSGQDRRAFRYVGAENRVCGTSSTPMANQTFGAAYVWKAIQVEGGWQFQNISDNLFIPQVTGNGDNITAAETGGTFTLTLKEGTTDQFIVSQVGNANSNGNLNWDGNNGNNPVMAIGNWGGTPHPYQFYPVTIPDAQLTVTFKKGDVTYGEATILLASGATYTLPAELGTMGTIENNAVTFTFADSVEPFKMVNCRRVNQWLTTNETGLYRTSSSEGSFSTGEWFIQQNVTNGFKIFSPAQGKYVGTYPNGAQIPFAGSFENAATITIQNNQNGPSVLINNSLGMNLWTGSDAAGTIAGYRYIANSVPDASCYWFMVYDEETFNANIVNYYVAGTTSDIPVNSDAHFLNTGTWYVAQQAAKDAIAAATEAAVDADEIAKVQALVDSAATAQFGKKGTDISALVTALNEGAITLNTAVENARDITLTIKKGDIVLSTHVYKGAVPEFPASLGEVSEIVDDQATLTIADANTVFKMVSARYNGVWGTTNDAGLYHTATASGSYDAGEYFVMVGSADNFNFFSPVKAQFVGTFNVNAQCTFSATPATFSIEHSQEGPVAIRCSNGVYMNDHSGNNAGNIGGWYKTQNENSTTFDAGSFWFLVEDNDAYEANKNSYWNDRTGFSGGALTTDSPWYAAQQAAKDAITSATERGVDAAEIAKVQTLVDAAATVNFGQAGVNISNMIDELESATTVLNDASSIAEVKAADAGKAEIYDLQGRRVATPAHGLYIVNGKKVLFN